MEENKFKCSECSKYYKSYQSLWNHKKKFHSILPQNNSISLKSSSIKPQNNSIMSLNKLLCEYCNKIYSRIDNLNRHKKNCKSKEILINQNDEIIKQQNEIIKQNSEIIKQNEELLKQTNSINQINNGTINNTSNNNSNNTITNNINIFKLGSETILENLPKEKQLCILRMPEYKALLEAIRITHFDKDHPEGHNWYNSNLRENFVIVYDKKNNKSMRDVKEEVIDFVIQQRINELEELGDKHKYELNDMELNNIDYIVKTDYPPHISEKVKIMAHQNKDIVSKTLNKAINNLRL
jgi:hypothetical protein